MIKISFVVPCKNEEKFIFKCINSILIQPIRENHYEVIVIDNGSTDNTLKILERFGSQIKIKIENSLSISELRNYGASISKGEWISFIDADVELDENWSSGLENVLNNLKEKDIDLKSIITGATYCNPDNPTWVQRVWYEQLISRDKIKNNYLNGGNLIVNRELFFKTNGFDSRFVTGEDVKFCEDAISAGGNIIKDESIRVVHHGYPKTIKDFFKRERWHGLGMRSHLLKPWKSRDLLLSIYYLILGIITIAMILTVNNVLVTLGFFQVALFLPILPIAIKRSSKKISIVVPLIFLYFVYGCARVTSLFDLLIRDFEFKKIPDS